MSRAKNPAEIFSMAPHVVAVVFFLWGSLCYIVGVAAPWTYLSFKVTAMQLHSLYQPEGIFHRIEIQNAYGDNLGITDEGAAVIPEYVQDLNCTRRKSDVFVWKGVCDDDGCTGFGRKDEWERLDSLNDEYGKYYKHAIETDFAGDDGKWKVVQAMVLLSVLVELGCFALYLYSCSCDEYLLQWSAKYMSLALVATAGTSCAAVAVSLSTYALAHQFYTGGGYYVKGWLVYSAFTYGCEGPQYLPGPGIVMQSMGALGMLILAMMLPCQCMMPRPREEGDFDYTPVAMAQPILQEEIVYEDA